MHQYLHAVLPSSRGARAPRFPISSHFVTPDITRVYRCWLPVDFSFSCSPFHPSLSCSLSFFLSLRFNFSLLLCASTLPFPSLSPLRQLRFSSSPPLSFPHPLAPFRSFAALRLLPTSPFSLLLLPFSVTVSRLSYPVFRFLFSFLCPLLSLSFFL